MNILLAYSTEQIGTELNPLHPNLRPSGTYNEGTQDWYLYLCTEILTADRVIGAWNSDGSVLVTATDQDGNPTAWYPIHPDYEEFIRPFGNDEGVATNSLDYHHWAGGGQRYLQEVAAPDTLAFYPTDTQPTVLEVRPKEFTGTWAGWGWRAEVLMADINRPPNARAIGIYSDPECLNYLYTTGGLVFGPSDWQTDENGDPIDAWATETPAGRADPVREPVNHALLFGAAQEGHETLEPEEDSDVHNYWEFDQSGAQSAGVPLVYNSGAIVSHINGDGTGPFGVTYGA